MKKISPLLFLLLLWGACYPPFNEQDLLKLKDCTPPEINILSPSSNGTSFAGIVEIRGKITDWVKTGVKNTDPQGLKNAWYAIEPAYGPGGKISIRRDGSFTFYFTTEGFTGPFLVTVYARDWMDNEGDSTVSFNNDGPFNNLYASSSQGRIAVYWDPIPMTERYEIMYSTSNNIPTDSYYEHLIDCSTNTRCVLEDPDYANNDSNDPLNPEPGDSFKVETTLLPFVKHSLIVKAYSQDPDVPPSISRVISAYPSSSRTLGPQVKSTKDAMVLSWTAIPGAPYYTILRASASEGNFSSIASHTGEPLFKDHLVNPGEEYYYRIMPEDIEDSISDPGRGTANWYTYQGSKIIDNYVSGGSFSQEILKKDNYVLVSQTGDSPEIQIYWINEDKTLEPLAPLRGFTVDINDMFLDGDMLYVALGVKGTYMIDCAVPHSPEFKELFSCPVDSYTVGVKNHLLFVGGENNGLGVRDISDPQNPLPASTLPMDGGIKEMKFIGDYLYMAVGGDQAASDQGLYVLAINWADPGESYKYAHFNSSSFHNLTNLELCGDRLYTFNTAGQINVLDVEAPGAPVVLGSFTHSNKSNYFPAVAEEKQLFILTRNEGIYVYDVQDPANFRNSGHYPEIQNARDMVKEGSYFITAGPSGGIHVIDTNAPDISAKGEIGVPGRITSIAYKMGLLFVLTRNNGLFIYDARDPENLQLISGSGTGGIEPGAFSGDKLKVVGNHLYIASSDKIHMLLINYTPPGDLSLVPYSKSSAMIPKDFEIRGDFLFTANMSNGFSFYDYTLPDNVKTIAHYSSYTTAQTIILERQRVYAYDTLQGLSAYDISAPHNPKVLYLYPDLCQGTEEALVVYNPRMAVQYPNLYISSSCLYCGYTSGLSSGFIRLDISNDAYPKLMNVTTFESMVIDLIVEGEYLYVAGFSGHMGIYSLDGTKLIAFRKFPEREIYDMEINGFYGFLGMINDDDPAFGSKIKTVHF